MKKAIQLWYDQNTEEELAYIARAGYQYVSMGFGDLIHYTRKDWEQAVVDIKELLNRFGLTCIQSHLPYYDLRISSEICDEVSEESIKACIDASAELGAKWCVYHPRTSINSGYSIHRAEEDNVKRISEYVLCSERAGIGLALENLPIFPTLPDMPFYSSDYKDLYRLVECFKGYHVGVCWDFGHANLMNFDQAEAIRYMGDKITCTHIHNNYKEIDEHLAPSLGTIDWKELMAALKDTGYQGDLTLEPLLQVTPMLEDYIRHTYHCVSVLEELYHSA